MEVPWIVNRAFVINLKTVINCTSTSNSYETGASVDMINDRNPGGAGSHRHETCESLGIALFGNL